MKQKLLVATACVVLLLAGCINKKAPPPISDKGEIALEIAELKLAEAAESVSRSLKRIAAIEEATAPLSKLPPPPDVYQLGMASLASVDWSGPVEPLLQKLAQLSDYSLQVLGKKPTVPVIVNIFAKDRPLGDILRDAQFQAIKETKIQIYPHTRVIELRYLTS